MSRSENHDSQKHVRILRKFSPPLLFTVFSKLFGPGKGEKGRKSTGANPRILWRSQPKIVDFCPIVVVEYVRSVPDALCCVGYRKPLVLYPNSPPTRGPIALQGPCKGGGMAILEGGPEGVVLFLGNSTLIPLEFHSSGIKVR